MANVVWDPTLNLDFATGENVPPAERPFDPFAGQIRIEAPTIRAHQYDAFEVGGVDLALILVRDAAGVALPPEQIRYAYVPGTQLRQIGLDGDQAPPGGNVLFANGDAFVVGDGTTGIDGDDMANTFVPGQGVFANYFLGLGGDDTALAAPGGGRLYGNTGQDSLIGGEGPDSIFAGKDDDVIVDIDKLFDEGWNLLAGDFGNDVITASGATKNLIYGGPGDDRFEWVAELTSPLSWNVVRAGDGNDRWTANGLDGKLFFHGDKGADVFEISGHLGQLEIDGGPGPDYAKITSAFGAGFFYIGGDGQDTVEVDVPQRTATLLGGNDDDQFRVFAGLLTGETDLLIEGGDGDDVIDSTGLLHRARFFGGGGDDHIRIEPGLVADNGLTFGFDLRGEDGSDTLEAGSGSARLTGGPGDDVLFGGADKDLFRFDGGPDIDGTDAIRAISPQFDGFQFGVSYNPTGQQVEVYKGLDGKGAQPQHNVLIATGATYSIGSFNGFLSEGQADTAKPGFYVFVVPDLGAQIWFDFDMASTDGATQVAELPEFTAPAALDAFGKANFQFD